MSIQIGLRQAEKQRIKFSFRIPFLPDPKQRISKKSSKKIQKIKKKKSLWHYFYPNGAEIGRERDEKNFVPNSIPT